MRHIVDYKLAMTGKTQPKSSTRVWLTVLWADGYTSNLTYQNKKEKFYNQPRYIVQ